MAASLFDPVPATPPSQEGYVLCAFENLMLAIPRADVVTIEQGTELAAALPGEAALGWFASSQGPWPAYALNRELQLHVEPTGSRTFLVFVRSDPWPLGILCDSVRILGARETLSPLALPALMQDAEGMISGVARIAKGSLVLICRAGGLAAHLAAHQMELAA
jgi:hypothetical protein